MASGWRARRRSIMTPWSPLAICTKPIPSAALAQQLGLDAQTLSETVARYNRDAAQGVDREFAKGGNSYNRAMGDPGHQPDACNAPCSARRSMPSNFIPAIWGPHGAPVTTADAQSSIPKETPSRGCTRWETTWIR